MMVGAQVDQVGLSCGVRRTSGLVVLLALAVLLPVLGGCAADESGGVEPISTVDAALTSASTREQQMAEAAEAVGVPLSQLPDVELVRYVTPDEYVKVHADCMAEQGFAPTSADGSLSFTVSQEAELDFGIAGFVCTAQYPLDLSGVKPMTEDRWVMMYEHFTRSSVPCLRALGYEPTEPPSLAVYLASPQEGRWDPYGDVERAVIDDALNNQRWDSFEDIYKECPPEPPDW